MTEVVKCTECRKPLAADDHVRGCPKYKARMAREQAERDRLETLSDRAAWHDQDR